MSLNERDDRLTDPKKSWPVFLLPRNPLPEVAYRGKTANEAFEWMDEWNASGTDLMAAMGSEGHEPEGETSRSAADCHHA